MSVARVAETPRVTRPFSEEVLGRARRARRAGRCRSRGGRPAAHHGRRADLRVGRRLSVARVDGRGARRRQARAGGRAHAPAARALRARRPAALRARQVVSGRSDAALGLRALLAARRQADVARRRADRARGRNDRADAPTMRGASPRRSRSGSASRRRACSRPTRIRCTGCRKRRRLPVNVDVRDPRLFDAAARARMVRTFERGLGTPAGYVLPLRRKDDAWASEAWELRREHLFLLPGDLPVGSRLPLAALPRVTDYPIVTQSDPMAQAPPLPDAADRAETGRGRDRAHRARGRAARRQAQRVHAVRRHARGLSRCSRRRRGGGRRNSKLPVHLEGYAPPFDPRLDVIKVTPDPGVIEVNLHPAQELARGGRHRAAALRGSPPRAPRHGKIHARRPPDRHRRRQPHRARRRDAGRQPVPAPAGPVEEHRALLAAPPVALLPVLRPVHRADQPVAARRRGASRGAVRARDRARAGAEGGRGRAALADRPAVPQPAGRRHRQYPSRRNLRRQAVLARFTDRPARPRRIPRLRDGAGRAHEPRAAIAGARAHRLVRARAARGRLRALGHRAA